MLALRATAMQHGPRGVALATLCGLEKRMKGKEEAHSHTHTYIAYKHTNLRKHPIKRTYGSKDTKYNLNATSLVLRCFIITELLW